MVAPYGRLRPATAGRPSSPGFAWPDSDKAYPGLMGLGPAGVRPAGVSTLRVLTFRSLRERASLCSAQAGTCPGYAWAGISTLRVLTSRSLRERPVSAPH
eukprot:NODE_11345_length_411_cov_6.008287_g10216_i0.p2 GENE.NODE_11345_length_411_cov_6.008287_g10216_i0~~NODE_11345_length_411_cov_6.008287_g10216_i0.p2  ORF type:complete len:100 (+),score=3.12 NODE_11345_length_411_cov_6.008287_g10216_i0:54-353(+)